MNDEPLKRYLALLEACDAEGFELLAACVSEDVHFRDPFNDCHGSDAFRRIFAEMFAQLDEIRFVVLHSARSSHAQNPAVALISWRLDARLKKFGNRPWQVTGCSEIHVSADGRVCAHYDYWDAAGQFYERLPVLGSCLRFLRRRLAVN